MDVFVPCPANDNILDRTRPLLAEDFEIILAEHAEPLGQLVDLLAKYPKYQNNPVKGALCAVEKMPDLQRDIVWRGSWLKRGEVDLLQEGGALLVACIEVIFATREEFSISSIQELIREWLTPFSSHLRAIS